MDDPLDDVKSSGSLEDEVRDESVSESLAGDGVSSKSALGLVCWAGTPSF